MYHAAMQVQFADGPPVEGMTMSPGALHGLCDPQLDGTIHTLLSLRARQGVAIRSPHSLVIARKVSKSTDVAIQSEA